MTMQQKAFLAAINTMPVMVDFMDCDLDTLDQDKIVLFEIEYDPIGFVWVIRPGVSTVREIRAKIAEDVTRYHFRYYLFADHILYRIDLIQEMRGDLPELTTFDNLVRKFNGNPRNLIDKVS